LRTPLVVLIFAAVVIGFFSDIVLGPDVLLDSNPYLLDPWRSHASEDDLSRASYRTDSFITYLPRQTHASRSLLAGDFPLWNPYIFCGAPFYADPQSQVLYPVAHMLAGADPARAMGYGVMIHFFLAMVGMYLFLRVIGGSQAGAMLAAFAYGFSSFFFTRFGHPTFIAAASWIPFYFYGFEKAQRCERTGTLLLTVFLILGYLAGFPQIFLFGVGGLVLYAVYLSIDRAVRGRAAWRKNLRVLGISGIIAFLIVSVQLLPFWEYVRHSVGLSIGFDKMRQIYLASPILLVRSFVPAFFGNPVEGTDWSPLTRDAHDLYNPGFMVFCGLGCLVVALAGLVFLRKSGRMRALLLLLLVSIGLATSTVLLRLVYVLVPAVGYSKIARTSVMGCFAVAAIGGMALSRISVLSSAQVRRSFLVALAVVVALVVVGSLVFMTIGESLVPWFTGRVERLPSEITGDPWTQLRSAKVLEWAESAAPDWLAYERRQMVYATALAILSLILVGIISSPGRWGRLLGRIARICFVVLVLTEVLLTARSYVVTQPRSSVWETGGIRFLKDAMRSHGNWRMMSIRPNPRDKSALPGNTNQVFELCSLDGASTIVPEAHSTLYNGFTNAACPSRLTDRTIPLSSRAILMSNMMSVRYMCAGPDNPIYTASPFFRVVAARDDARSRVGLLRLGNETRLALMQSVRERFNVSMDVPQFSALDLHLGFRSEAAAPGDSVAFLLLCSGQSGEVRFGRSFDINLDRDRWHLARVDVSSIGGGPVQLMLMIALSNPEHSGGLRAGWGSFDLVHNDCEIAKVDRGYQIRAGEGTSFAAIEVTSEAAEVPLEIHYGDRHKRIRWLAFPEGFSSRSMTLDLEEMSGDRIRVLSDTAFTVERATVIHGEQACSDIQLIHDGDVCIYENHAVAAKGICIDRAAVGRIRSEGKLRLSLASIDTLEDITCGTCRILAYGSDEVILDVHARRDCYLLFQDLNHPGWRAYADGEITPMVENDIGIRVIGLSEGEHRITMRFEPRSLRIGFLLACLGISLAVVYAFKSPIFGVES
jgi:hypothetical protein